MFLREMRERADSLSSEEKTNVKENLQKSQEIAELFTTSHLRKSNSARAGEASGKPASESLPNAVEVVVSRIGYSAPSVTLRFLWHWDRGSSLTPPKAPVRQDR